MGFYYSYYKTIVEEKTFASGISKIMYDQLVEYPKDVNAFNRFNINPEVSLMFYIYIYFWVFPNIIFNKESRILSTYISIFYPAG